MQSTTTNARKGASVTARVIAGVFGAICAAVALVLLLHHPITTGDWQLKHVIVPAMLFIAIVSGKLVYQSWRAGVRSSSALFQVIWCMATAVIIVNSVGNLAESHDHKVAAVAALKGQAAHLDQRIDWLQGRIAEDSQTVTDEIRGIRDGRRVTAGCGRVCQDTKRTIEANRALLIDVQAARAALPPIPPAHSKALRWGQIASFFGGPGEWVTTAVTLLEPVFIALALELGAIAGFGFAFYSPKGLDPEPLAADAAPVPAAHNTLRLVDSQPADHPIIAELKRGGPAQSQDELAKRMGLSKGEISKSLAEVDHLVAVTRIGRFNRIALRRAA